MRERHEKAMNLAIQELKQCKGFIYVKKIYLYGSCARGEEKYNSDVDLMICVQEDTPKKVYRELRCAANIGDYTLPEVNVEFTNSDRFSFSRQFDCNVRKDGILIWERH